MELKGIGAQVLKVELSESGSGANRALDMDVYRKTGRHLFEHKTTYGNPARAISTSLSDASIHIEEVNEVIATMLRKGMLNGEIRRLTSPMEDTEED